MKIVFTIVSFLTISCSFGQNPDIEIIRETLPGYLNDSGASIVSYTKGNKMYDFLKTIFEESMELEKNELEKDFLAKEWKSFEQKSDSINTVLKSNKIRVYIQDSLFSFNYDYKPSDTISLRLLKKENWEATESDLVDDLTRNSMARLKKPISKDYVALIKKQVYASKGKTAIDLSLLNNPQYTFSNAVVECDSKNGLCIQGYKLYPVVFNKAKDKACFLIALKNIKGISRDFVFVEKVNNKWIYLDNYPSYLVDGYDLENK